MKDLYAKQNYVLARWICDEYMPFLEKKWDFASLALACYREKTGEALTLAEVRAYMAREHEADGSLRIYSSGRWPAIERYVRWGLANESVMDRYIGEIIHMQYELRREYPTLYSEPLCEHNLDELVKLHADRGYRPAFGFE